MKINHKKIMYIFLIILGFFVALSYIIFPMLNSGFAVLEISGAIVAVATFLGTIKVLTKIFQNKQNNEEQN